MNPKRFCNVCNTNDVQGLRTFQNLGFKKYLLKYLHQKLKGQITLKKKLKIIFRNFFYFVPKNSLGFLIRKLPA